MATTRRYIPADRTWVEPLIGAPAIDAKGNHIEIVEDGADRAVAVWFSPENEAGGLAQLGPVLTVGEERRDMFNAAIVAVCEAGIAEGHVRGQTIVLDRRVKVLLERDFGVKFTPVGRNVKTDEPGYWELEVDLAEIVATAKSRGLA